MEAKWYRARKCYRVWVPARLSEKGKDCRRFFETREQAQKFIFETKRSGSVELEELAVEERHVLSVIRQSEKYEPKLLLEAWRRFESEGTGNGSNFTVLQLCEKFLARQIAERRSPQILADDRWRLNAFSRGMGQSRAEAVKRSDILGYLEAIPPGTNRRSHSKTLRKLWRWAIDLGHVENDPMARLKPLDAWGVNNEVLSVETLAWGFSHFNTMSKIVRRLLGYNTTVKCYFPGRLPRSFLLLFFRQTLAVWELAVDPNGVRGIFWMTCQEASKRLGEPIGNEQRATCVAASKGL